MSMTKFGDVIVVDDVIPSSYQDYLAKHISDENFPWYWQPEVVAYDSSFIKNINNNWIPCYGLSHLIYCKPINRRSGYFDMFYPMVTIACEAVDIKDPPIQRIRAGLITRIGDSALGRHHMPHADAKMTHTTMLYYPVDADGDTYMFDRFIGQEDQGSDEFITITPKKGRAVFFNGQRYHASSNPINSDFRAVINVNIFD